MNFELRAHQTRTQDAVRASWLRGRRRPLVVLPTGAGKTITLCSIAEPAINRKGRRALWLTHRRELVGQASASLTRAGVEHGVILSGRPTRPDLPMQVASVQTLTAAGRAPEANIIFIDEAHHTVASTWKAIIEAYPQAELIVGCTATPERGDRSPLGDVFDDMIVGATIRELVGAGFLVPCDVIAPAKYLDKGIAEDPLDALDRHGRAANGSLRRTILFASSVPEANAIASRANKRGIRAACVDGSSSIEAREQNLAAFARGELDLLTNVYCLTEGYDCPGVEVCVIARGCSSAATYLQMVGRVLRPAPGKTRALLLDLRGVVHQHGMPDDAREFSLTGKAIRTTASLPPLSQCRACGAVFRAARVCVRCGAVAPPRPPQRMQRAPLRSVTHTEVASTSERRKYFDELVGRAVASGYKPAWIGMQFKGRFGFWPPWPLPKQQGGARA